MNIVCYGGGVNSTALIIHMVRCQIAIDIILFADTGGEKPHTYGFILEFNEWLKAKGLPSIITVRSHLPPLYENCIEKKELPAIVYGFKSCSDKWKIRPVDKYLRQTYPGQPILKFIGIDADEAHRAIPSPRKWYSNRFPLVEADIGRDDCVDIIRRAGLRIPDKSACYFCPSSKQHEVRELQSRYPELAQKCMEMERNADLTKIKGLGRSYSWTNLLATNDLFASPPIEISCGCYDG